jgi:hypothetical protein|tara:strand:+ start:374 stop:586 length:213 start_codon:yes stop_codon:yes gene_type:complete
MSENPEEIVVDVAAQVIEETEEDIQKETKMSEKQLRKFQRDRVTQINKVLKNIKRRKKNLIHVIKQMDDK